MSIIRFERRYDVTLEQALTLNTVPVLLEQARPGYAFQLECYSVIRRGQRFLTQPGALTLRAVGSTNIAYGIMGSTNWLTVLGQDPTRFSYIGRGTYVGGGADDPTHYGSKAVELIVANGNLTVDENNPGGPLAIVIEWRLLPTYAETA